MPSIGHSRLGFSSGIQGTKDASQCTCVGMRVRVEGVCATGARGLGMYV
ncbi:hypothetical protein E2C01_074749 [Portunus trituberculatus]|uniref:Uncharacterized protein n=1 Tax=Portunus trituberculatus TaxID=210409 RepID=A0A5B7IEB1_PORTR|nr:hypothetical protein [Portunus trituberculatus]